jgi:hypothetical protein
MSFLLRLAPNDKYPEQNLGIAEFYTLNLFQLEDQNQSSKTDKFENNYMIVDDLC